MYKATLDKELGAITFLYYATCSFVQMDTRFFFLYLYYGMVFSGDFFCTYTCLQTPYLDLDEDVS